jgi:hypothetical protein
MSVRIYNRGSPTLDQVWFRPPLDVTGTVTESLREEDERILSSIVYETSGLLYLFVSLRLRVALRVALARRSAICEAPVQNTSRDTIHAVSPSQYSKQV